jgi:predicted adenine nucleotide alpha hydrolase (AANH) superfamily ATPase
MRASAIDLTVYFYNPNIHPREEYDLRKSENIRFAEKHSIPFVDADYDTENWFARAKGLEWEPERGARCTM